jgi:sterol desaturase/sphingolipid hydroxylase (fatty acid hydroxylase superfamily)
MFFSLMILWNVYVHVGMEFLPKRLAESFLGGWIGTPTHHNVHHRVFSGNYGLWFNIWDRLMGTNHPTYMKTLIAKSSISAENRTGKSNPKRT